MLSLDHRFYHVGAKYRYDWRVDLLSGEVLLLTTKNAATGDIILDAKWQGHALGDPVWLDRLVGQSLPLAMGEDPWQAAIVQGVWTPFGEIEASKPMSQGLSPSHREGLV